MVWYARGGLCWALTAEIIRKCVHTLTHTCLDTLLSVLTHAFLKIFNDNHQWHLITLWPSTRPQGVHQKVGMSMLCTISPNVHLAPAGSFKNLLT
jgi:hypothetical protein